MASKIHSGHPNVCVFYKSDSISFPDSFLMVNVPSSSKVKWFEMKVSHGKVIGQKHVEINSGYFLLVRSSIVLAFSVSNRLEH